MEARDNVRLAILTWDDGVSRIAFERVLPCSPAALWATLTQPAELARWLPEALDAPREDGVVHFYWSDGGGLDAPVVHWAPPRSFELAWPERGAPDSHVRFAVDTHPHGSQLRLTHTRAPATAIVDHCAGWHLDLEELEAHLGLRSPPLEDRYRALQVAYSALRNTLQSARFDRRTVR